MVYKLFDIGSSSPPGEPKAKHVDKGAAKKLVEAGVVEGMVPQSAAAEWIGEGVDEVEVVDPAAEEEGGGDWRKEYVKAKPDQLTKGAIVYAWAASDSATRMKVLDGPKDLVSGGGIALTTHYKLRKADDPSDTGGWIPLYALYVKKSAVWCRRRPARAHQARPPRPEIRPARPPTLRRPARRNRLRQGPPATTQAPRADPVGRDHYVVDRVLRPDHHGRHRPG